MSMLAERRQKQKWTLNPRGKWWAEDSNKFGQKMLEKMGWTKGKGLGANEQGITEFSSIPCKSDTTGIGFNKSFEEWTEQQEKFDNFLQELNNSQGQDTVKNKDVYLSGQSIELKSKQSHARVHYKKFTCGKDINKYKLKDLANILGQKDLIDKPQDKIEKNSDNHEIESSGSKDNWYGVVTVNGGNMNDYFKLKYNSNNISNKYNLKSNNNNLSNSNNQSINNQVTDSESENDQHVGFGFTNKIEDTSVSSCEGSRNSDKSNYAFDNPCLKLNSPIEIASGIDSSGKSKKRKKKVENEINKHNRKKLKSETVETDCKNGFINPALNLDTPLEENYNGKDFEVFRTQFGLENCALDLTDEQETDKKRVTFNDHIMLYEYDIHSAKKKKEEVMLDKFEIDNKKSKKKRKREDITNGFVNEALDEQILHEEINDNELNEHINKKMKKRKIRKTSNLETIQESPEKEIIEMNSELKTTLDIGVMENEETNIMKQKSKKKKKKKAKEEIKANDENIVLHVVNEEEIENKKLKKINKETKENKETEEETESISKKYKNKKKNKENYNNENCTAEPEINNEQEDNKILDKSQQNDDLIENKNKEIIIESVSMTKEEEKERGKESSEKIKHKKKKRKSINKEEHSSIDVCNVEREVSNKENADKEQELNTKKLKKDKKHKKLKDKNATDIGNLSNNEIIDPNITSEDKIENTEITDISPEKSKAIDTIISSPWNIKARISKKMLITLFHNKAISEFPGSNIHSIKGYGVDPE